MSIRVKTILIIGFTVVAMMTVSFGAAFQIFIRRFDELEITQMKGHLDNVKNVFDQQVTYLLDKSGDWAIWDDAYAFIQDRNKKFITSNLQDSTFETLNIEGMIFVDADKNVAYSKYYSISEKTFGTLPDELLRDATQSAVFTSLLSKDVPIKGVTVIGGKPLLVAGRSILPSSSIGSIKGYVLFLRFLDDAYIKELGDALQLPLAIETISESRELKEHIDEEFKDNVLYLVEPKSDTQMEADRLIADIKGENVLYVHMLLPRELHQQGLVVGKYLIAISIGITIVLLALLWLVLNKFILSRILLLNQKVHDIETTGGKHVSLPVDSGSDEISQLIQAIQSMFASLSKSKFLLHTQESQMKQYFDSASVMIVVISADQTIVSANQKLSTSIGFSLAEMQGKKWVDLVIESEKREAYIQEFNQILQGEKQNQEYFESSIVTKSGEKKMVGWHVSFIKNETGENIGLQYSGEDISARNQQQQAILKKNEELEQTKSAVLNILDDQKSLEEELKSERDRANMIISTMNEGLFVVDTNKIIVTANQASAKMMGLEIADMIGKKLTSIVTLYKSETNILENDRPITKTLETGSSLSFGLDDDQYMEGKNGKIPVAISTIPLKKDDVIIGALVTFHDISRDKEIKETIEKQVQERTQELHDERAKLVASINSLNMGYQLMDTDGKPLIANAMLSSILNSNNTVMSIEDIDSMFGDVLDLVHRFRNCVNDKKVIQEADIPFRGKIIKIWLVPVVATVNARDTVIGAVLLVEDVTERKVLERSKDEFFSIASHELRTPLTAIRGNTSMLMDFYGDKMPDGDMKEMIEDIHKSSIRLIDIVNDFLNVSRLEQKRLDFTLGTFDLKDLSLECIAEFEGSVREKGLTLRFEETEGIPSVFADKDRTKQVVLNLIGNAVKFVDTGEICLKLEKDGDMVKCLVRDTGRGILKENQSLLFHKFQQAGSSLFTRDTTRGTGLGLYVIRQLIEENHGGKITFTSVYGQGSELRIILPAFDGNTTIQETGNTKQDS